MLCIVVILACLSNVKQCCVLWSYLRVCVLSNNVVYLWSYVCVCVLSNNVVYLCVSLLYNNVTVVAVLTKEH